MEIFNIGPLELIIIIIIMFLLLGPKEMILTANRIGRWIRKVVRSPMWREIMGYSMEIRELPKKLMDDTGLKEALDEVNQTTQATANELNATMRQAVEEARVPEAEHVKLETSPVEARPGAAARSTATPPTVQKENKIVPPEVEAVAASAASAVSVTAGSVDPNAGEPEPAAEAKPRRGRPRKTAPVVEEPAAPAISPATESAPETVPEAGAKPRRGRPRKTAAASVEVAPQPAESAVASPASFEPQVPAEPATDVKPRQTRTRKTAASKAAGESMSPAETAKAAPILAADPVQETASQPAPEQAAPAAPKPRLRRSRIHDAGPAAVGTANNGSQPDSEAVKAVGDISIAEVEPVTGQQESGSPGAE